MWLKPLGNSKPVVTLGENWVIKLKPAMNLALWSLTSGISRRQAAFFIQQLHLVLFTALWPLSSLAFRKLHIQSHPCTCLCHIALPIKALAGVWGITVHVSLTGWPPAALIPLCLQPTVGIKAICCLKGSVNNLPPELTIPLAAGNHYVGRARLSYKENTFWSSCFVQNLWNTVICWYDQHKISTEA